MARSKASEREPIREPVRDNIPAGRAVAVGRDGKPVFRRQTNSTDQFYIPPEFIEPGWSMEWKRCSLFGQPQSGYIAENQNNGWAAVNTGRFPGYFLPETTDPNAPVIRGDLMLMERPLSLTEEARKEDRERAQAAVQNRMAQHGLQSKLAGLNGRIEEVRGKDGTFISQERGVIEVDRAEYDLG
jgi:hypothetical protein